MVCKSTWVTPHVSSNLTAVSIFHVATKGATMRNTVVSVPAHKPRNSVVRALIAKIRQGSGRHALVRDKRKQAKDDNDLAQRVRDVGEW